MRLPREQQVLAQVDLVLEVLAQVDVRRRGRELAGLELVNPARERASR